MRVGMGSFAGIHRGHGRAFGPVSIYKPDRAATNRGISSRTLGLAMNKGPEVVD